MSVLNVLCIVAIFFSISVYILVTSVIFGAVFMSSGTVHNSALVYCVGS